MISILCTYLETWFGIDCPDILVTLGRWSIYLCIVIVIFALNHDPKKDDDIYVDSRGKFFFGNSDDFEQHEEDLRKEDNTGIG